MAKVTARHAISDNLAVFLQDNCKNWYARFKVQSTYYTKTTRQKDLAKAITKAHRILFEYEIRAETNTLFNVKKFSLVAQKVIEQMQQDNVRGEGKSAFTDYIAALKNYHIPFFGDLNISKIDQDLLKEFDIWRNKTLGRNPAKSTIQNHNTAFQLVFDFAVERNWMLEGQVPRLHNTGADGQRRAAFSIEEFAIIREQIVEMQRLGRKEVTRSTRELLLDYVDFALLTGLRPGSEMDNLTWGDLHIERVAERCRLYVTVRKGKTTKYTGTREVVCKEAIVVVVDRLTHRFPNRRKDEHIFRLADGSRSKELSRNFDLALHNCNLKMSQYGERSLYSLRHTYITWELVAQNVPIDVIARQCGTGIQMIEQHYSHVIPRMFGKQLSGVEADAKKQVEKQFTAVIYDSCLLDKISRWTANYKRRNFI